MVHTSGVVKIPKGTLKIWGGIFNLKIYWIGYTIIDLI